MAELGTSAGSTSARRLPPVKRVPCPCTYATDSAPYASPCCTSESLSLTCSKPLGQLTLSQVGLGQRNLARLSAFLYLFPVLPRPLGLGHSGALRGLHPFLGFPRSHRSHNSITSAGQRCTCHCSNITSPHRQHHVFTLLFWAGSPVLKLHQLSAK